jgi:hypothetical protein
MKTLLSNGLSNLRGMGGSFQKRKIRSAETARILSKGGWVVARWTRHDIEVNGNIRGRPPAALAASPSNGLAVNPFVFEKSLPCL